MKSNTFCSKMITIDNKIEPNLIFIDKNVRLENSPVTAINFEADTYKLILHSRSTNIYETYEVEDTYEFWNYWSFNVDFSELDAGEYEFILVAKESDEEDAKDMRLASGMIKIADSPSDTVVYTQDVTFAVYDPTKTTIKKDAEEKN